MPTAIGSARPDHDAPVLAVRSELAELLASKISLSRAARMLDLSVCQLHRLRLCGKLRCFKVAGRWFTTEDSIGELIQFSGTYAVSAPAVPTTTARRRAEVEAADRECELLGC